MLISRWLYNVNAVKLWREADGVDARTIAWWGQQHAVQENIFGDADFHVGKFIGQGRAPRYAGLSHAVIESHFDFRDDFKKADFPRGYRILADRVKYLTSRRTSWFLTAIFSEALVLTQVMLAYVLAFNTPTVGLGCFSGSAALYALLSSLSWAVTVCSPRQTRVSDVLSQFLNLLAFCWLIILIILVVRSSRQCLVDDGNSEAKLTSGSSQVRPTHAGVNRQRYIQAMGAI